MKKISKEAVVDELEQTKKREKDLGVERYELTQELNGLSSMDCHRS
jgi:hypothetical protein